MRFLLYTLLLTAGSHLLAQSNLARAEELYDLALEAYRTRSYVNAERYISESLNIKSDYRSHYLSGLILEAQGKDLRAVAAYEATLQLKPDFYEAFFQKGLVYLRYGDPRQAVKDFTILIDKKDTFRETRSILFQIDETGGSQNKILTSAGWTSRLYYYRGQAYAKLSLHQEALEDYNQAIESETLPEYYISRGLLYQTINQATAAKSDFRRALSIDPENSLAWYNLVLLDPSTHVPDQLMRTESFAPTLTLVASRALEEGDLSRAKRYFDLAIATDATDALVFVNRGRCFLKMGNYTAAREDFIQARRLDPARMEVLYLLGNSYFYQRDYEQAVAYYNQFLSFDPTSAMIWYNGAMCYLGLNDKVSACHYLQRAGDFGMVEAGEMKFEHCQ